MEKKSKLVLIDGHAILHRAFRALPPLITSGGEEVGAVFGFCSMLLRVLGDLKPQYLVVAFDRPAPTFRQKLFPKYQSQRPPMADELVSQVDLTHEVLGVLGVPIFELDGWEADDLIGTIAKKTEGEIEIIIISGDRDMLQLVDEDTRLYAPVKGLTQTVLFDEKTVEEKYSLKPKQWVDFKALVGDPSDNYPGVSGIGPKTAVSLLCKYETFENIYRNLAALPARQAGVLREGREQAELAKKLAQIATDAPIQFDLKKCELKNWENPQVEELFQKLEFKSLWARIVKGDSKESKKNDPRDENQLSLLEGQ